MAKRKEKRKPPKLITLTLLQHLMLEIYRDGKEVAEAELDWPHDYVGLCINTIKRITGQLVKKGCASVLTSKSGVRVIVDVGAGEYMVTDERYIWPEWRSGNVRKVAEAIARDSSWDDLPVLADALEEAGCDDVNILGFLRSPLPATTSAGDVLEHPGEEPARPDYSDSCSAGWRDANRAWWDWQDRMYVWNSFVCPRVVRIRQVRRLCARLSCARAQ